jgi:EpsI family protein
MELKSKRYWLVVALLLVTGIYVHILRYTRILVKEQVNLEALPMKIGKWQAEENLVMEEDIKEILKSSQDLWRAYTDSNHQQIDFFMAYFKDQKYGEQIHSPKHCLPGSGWKIVDRETFVVQLQDSPAAQLKINKLVISKKYFNEIMLYWFWTRSGVITSEYELKFSLAKNALLRNPTDAAFIRINLPLPQGDRSKALQAASQFISDIFPEITNVLPFQS